MTRIAEVDNYIATSPAEHQDTLRSLRDLIFEAVPDTKESFKWKQPVYATEKDYLYLKANKGHVNLGFFSFEKIEDPAYPLEGTGKRMRHIKIKSMADFDRDGLKDMILQASKFS
ncbi:MAG: DUF1801 domain-containing protein [Saprospiraceae bacterium]|nr:DUF1801 domain-containing protein [Saprospiraceae bacterium]